MVVARGREQVRNPAVRERLVKAMLVDLADLIMLLIGQAVAVAVLAPLVQTLVRAPLPSEVLVSSLQ